MGMSLRMSLVPILVGLIAAISVFLIFYPSSDKTIQPVFHLPAELSAEDMKWYRAQMSLVHEGTPGSYQGYDLPHPLSEKYLLGEIKAMKPEDWNRICDDYAATKGVVVSHDKLPPEDRRYYDSNGVELQQEVRWPAKLRSSQSEAVPLPPPLPSRRQYSGHPGYGLEYASIGRLHPLAEGESRWVHSDPQI